MTGPTPRSSRREHSVLVLYTGGTFGMHETERGRAPDPEFPDVLTSMLIEATDPDGAPDSMRLVPFEHHIEPPIDSSNADSRTAVHLAAHIHDSLSMPQFKRLAGVIVIHGTDTLAYTAARLAFELHDLQVPVILTGSQLPHGAPGSDAEANLQSAFSSIASSHRTDLQGTWIAFADQLVPAVRAMKVSSTDPRGFGAMLPLAHEPSGVPELPSIREAAEASGAASQRNAAARIITFRFTPGVIAADLLALASTHPDALVLECYGAGNAPMSQPGMPEAVRDICDRLPVVAVSQCLTGGVSLGRYATGFELAEIGVIDGSDLTTEAAIAKLGFLLDRGVGGSSLADAMQQNFLGECTPVS